MDGGILIVHGFSRGEIVANLRAVLGSRADTIAHVRAPNGIVAFASSLSGGDPEATFGDSEAVTALALDHARVLAGLAAVSDVVPLRLGTIVSGVPALAVLCEGQAEAMSGVLDAISGRVEFGVRVLLRPEEPEAAPGQAASSGRSYLRARAIERTARQQMSERQHTFCQSLADRLRTMATVRTLAADAPRAAEGRVIDLACLVERARANDLADHLAMMAPEARSLGLDVDVTGPWPAYSFVAPHSGPDAH